ncbi:MAG: biotin--[acetyl-CoA-carboxylase] ligase [Verrucomicrobiia bacterium]|jgi:BirA family biotin operon repressor/biotin-[acetyl-CoA-carboxylase] ligase
MMTAGTAILETFYRAAGQFVSLAELERARKRPTTGVAAEIAELQGLGYRIEVHPHLGYRLVAMPDRLIADDIKARLESFHARSKPRVIGSEILVFEQTSSTNDVVARMAESRRGEGLVVFAESQTKGRGRRGRAWASPRGKGLWFSVLLRPNLPLSSAPRITVAASVAVARAIRKACELDARIKWPNDVTVNGRKVAGILTELSAEGDEILSAILGIGIDVNCRREDFPSEVAAIATSVELEAGRAFNRPALAADILQVLDDAYLTAQTDFDSIIAEWAQLCTTLGKQIVVTMGKRRIEGHAQALDGDGALLLRKDNGQIERILGGDLTVERA